MAQRLRVVELFLAVGLTASMAACTAPSDLRGKRTAESTPAPAVESSVERQEGGEGGEGGEEGAATANLNWGNRFDEASVISGFTKATEIDQATLEASTFYVQTLGVPARTLMQEAMVRKGERLFEQANCTACHLATVKTGSSPIRALDHQTIHPYTDLLLHDLGPGLADNRPDFEASGQEWRTSPLWGLGLTQTVLPFSGYLHDGRARTVEEAILWHGGEAEKAQQRFVKLSLKDRQALLKFLNTL